MNNQSYIIALDQGTTSSRTIIFDIFGNIISVSQKEFTQIFPHSGWVEHDAIEIWNTQLFTIEDAIQKSNILVENIKAIGITNQRETAVVWDKYTGIPIYNAIVWQDRRTANICEQLKMNGLTEYISENTGLVPDAYFSGTKIKWMLENVPNANDRAQNGELLFGTIDTWLLWNLSNGQSHATDFTNASRTMIFNIKTKSWDEKLLKEFSIPKSILPEVRNSASHFGFWTYKNHQIPITGIAGDQQAALFGQHCFGEGDAKNTYGTGCFMLMNTGNNHIKSKNGLLTTLACGTKGEPVFALEGSVFIAGAAIQWLRDGLQIIQNAKETNEMVHKTESNRGVYVVPAFVGLGTPYWDMYARGGIFGLTRDTDKNLIVRATLEAIAYQTKDVLEVMQQDSGLKIKQLKVDGGATNNDFLMQFQSDILNIVVEKSESTEATAKGVYYLALIGAGIYSIDQILNQKSFSLFYEPNMEEMQRQKLYSGWKKAVQRCLGWEEN